MNVDMSRLFLGDCFEGIGYLSETYGQFVDTVVTSPPYAEQRKHQYGGISESEYPQWTVEWMRKVREVLKPDGSVFINIRPHIKNGVISDYVLRTRLALREDGWKECEEIIWYKPDSPPLGSVNRPRRAWEHILWFSPTNKPYCDPKANGQPSNRVGFENNKFEHGGRSHIHAGQNSAKQGVSRSVDVIIAGTGKTEKGFTHPAMFPKEVPTYLIKMSCPEGGFVLDPFSGSGTTVRSAIELRRGFVGFESNLGFFNESEDATLAYIRQLGLEDFYVDFMEVNADERT